ncbi:MAG TPA: histidine phosphatase family protein [Ktedonobacterales bacterium]
MASSATRLILVRHGEAEGNRELRYLGASDVPLTARGQAQAGLLAEAVRALGPAALYTSPLQRARQTASAIAAATHLEPQPLDALREMDFGAWERLSRAEVVARDPAVLAAWERGADWTPPDGESLTQVGARITACAELLAARHPSQTIALVSHVGPIKALVCAALDLPPTGARRMWLDTASVSLVEWRTDSPSSGVLRLFNATSHLDALPR